MQVLDFVIGTDQIAGRGDPLDHALMTERQQTHPVWEAAQLQDWVKEEYQICAYLALA